MNLGMCKTLPALIGNRGYDPPACARRRERRRQAAKRGNAVIGHFCASWPQHVAANGIGWTRWAIECAVQHSPVGKRWGANVKKTGTKRKDSFRQLAPSMWAMGAVAVIMLHDSYRDWGNTTEVAALSVALLCALGHVVALLTKMRSRPWVF